MRKPLRGIALSFLLLLWPLYGEDTGITKEQADQILGELRQIRRILEDQAKGAVRPAQDPVTKLKMQIGDAPVLGAPEAPITIIEFTDYQCPYCQRFHLATFGLLKRDYIDTGKVKYVSRDLPLTEIHPHALRAAQAARCAGDQNQFWAFRDQLQRNGSALELTNLLDYAGKLNLDIPSFRACVEKEKYKNAVENDRRQATGSGVNATPSFLVGKSTRDEVEGELVSGALSYEMFSAKLKVLLDEPSGR